jgi:hypothetical protein
MLFNIDQDGGSQIVGWVMPNNPSFTPRIRVLSGDETKGIFDATQYRPLLKEQGLHDTGICGFVLDETIVPGLVDLKELAIFDEDSDLLLYRRRPPGKVIESKLFRVETRLLRTAILNDLLAPNFHMVYAGLEMLTEETVFSVLAIPYTNSIYATGRIFVRALEHQLRDRNFKTAILIRDPFEELAERLWVLKLVASNEGASFIAILGKDVQAAARSFRDVNLDSTKDLADMLTNLGDDSKPTLANTLTRQLASKGGIDTLDKFSVSAALDTLAEIDVVGLASDPDGFIALLNNVLADDKWLDVPILGVSERVSQLADVLRTMPAVQKLIGMDIELFDVIKQAFQITIRRDAELLGAAISDSGR